MRFRANSMFVQLSLVLIVLQCVIVFVSWWLIAGRVSAFFTQQQVDELRGLSSWVVTVLQDAELDSTPVQKWINQLEHDTEGLRITVVDREGTVVGDSSKDPARMDNHRQRPEIIAAFRDGDGTASRYSDTLGTEFLYYAKRVADPDGMYIVRVALPLTLVQQSLASLTRTMLLALVITLGATVVVIFLVTRWLSARIQTLSDGAERFAAGDLGHRIRGHHMAELDGLSSSLNTMAAELAARVVQIERQGNEIESVLQSMSNGVIALDLSRRILSMNQAAVDMLDLEGRSVRGRVLDDVLQHDDLLGFAGDSIRHGGRRFEEFAFEAIGGLRVECASEPLHDEQHEVVGLLLVMNDVTALRRLESIRTDFAANVSHELRTPIMAIQGYADLLADDTGNVGESDRSQYLGIIQRNTVRLAAIIEDLLSLSRLEETGSSERLEWEEIPLRAMLEDVCRDCAETAKRRDVDLLLSCPDDIMMIGSRQLLTQAVDNLVENAIRHSELYATVDIVGAIDDHARIAVEVRDHGTGIPSEYHDRIFERFYRVDKGRDRLLGGTGLGLAIVKHIAMVHGGRVTVSSEVGEGSIFTLLVPQKPQHAGDGDPVPRMAGSHS